MSAPKPKAKPGLLWRWFDAVEAVIDGDDLTEGQCRHIMAVAFHRARHASPDGSRCYPAQVTIARKARIKRDAVRDTDTWLVENGLMVKTGRTGLGGTIAYRLTVPFDGLEDDPIEGQVPQAKMTPDGAKFTPEDDPELDPELDPVRGHNLLPPNVVRGEGGGAHAHAPSLPAVESGCAALSGDDRSSAFKLIISAMSTKPTAWSGLSRDHDKLITEAHRLRLGGWTAEQLCHRLDDLPGDPRKVRTKSGLIAGRLAKLPTEPGSDEALADAVADDPVHWATRLAQAFCGTVEAEFNYIWEPVDSIDDRVWGITTETYLPSQVAAWVCTHELELSTRIVDELVALPIEYGGDGGAADAHIIDEIVKLLTFAIGDRHHMSAAEQAEQLREAFERLPEIAVNVSNTLTVARDQAADGAT